MRMYLLAVAVLALCCASASATESICSDNACTNCEDLIPNNPAEFEFQFPEPLSFGLGPDLGMFLRLVADSNHHQPDCNSQWYDFDISEGCLNETCRVYRPGSFLNAELGNSTFGLMTKLPGNDDVYSYPQGGNGKCVISHRFALCDRCDARAMLNNRWIRLNLLKADRTGQCYLDLLVTVPELPGLCDSPMFRCF